MKLSFFHFVAFLIASTSSLAEEFQLKDQHKMPQDRCLTVHGIHSAKALGLANSDWKVPKDHLCSPVKN